MSVIYRIAGYFRIKKFRTSVLISISVVLFLKSVYFDGFIFEVGIYISKYLKQSCLSYLNATILQNFPLLNNTVIIAVQ